MGRTKASCRQCRREKEKLFLKGDKCATKKCPVERRKYPPGQHGAANTRISEFGKRMREKQKAKRIYGLTETQFRNYFERAAKKTGATGQKLMELLERRLDNAVYRFGYTASRQAARQVVHHGHVMVNNRKVDIPSFEVKIGDKILIKPGILERAKDRLKEYTPPAWLSLNEDFTGDIIRLPSKDDTEKLVLESAIVEYYSR
ncbi:MAG: small subunit ribosomal protein S4 [Candidatus Saganbacteria bacterium]|uniref:Small ribosomal subunit protein uS4 n=1 Tax=Candidatus Saganbacteria bacterium TaxID=2575572 RepID=A0A833L140_UNCSA|nr:MAG: small subunit ribosomal protein S4 [Candidatus Saganbacteria bacterium]